MQLRDGDSSLLGRADRTVQDLLRNELKDARVALFKSREAASSENLATAAELLAQWTPLDPKAGARLLGDRIAAARTMLSRQAADQKWLVVLSDFQSREFPRAMESLPDGRTVLLDLHPSIARSAGITHISIHPAQSVPGIASEVAVDVAGRAGESRAVLLGVLKPDGSIVLQPPPLTAMLDAGGRGTLRAALKLPAEPWLLVEARFADEDAMGWDDARSLLVHLPPRQNVRVLDFTTGSQAARFVRLALDPNEGKLASWPLVVRAGGSLGQDDRVAVVLMSKWPETAVAQQLAQLASAGQTVILLAQPGMETSWKDLPDEDRAAWLKLLPGEPTEAAFASPLHLVPPSADQSPLGDVLSGADFQTAIVRRMIRFDPANRLVETLLSVGSDASRKLSLLFRRPLGAGQVFTLATLPDARFTNLATHPIFLPMLVRLALQSPERRDSLNVEVGQSITLAPGGQVSGPVTIESPGHETFQVPAASDDAKRFAFTQTNQIGLYTWRAGGQIIGYTNVQPPAAESELIYRPAGELAARGDNVLVVHSLDEMRQKMQQLAEPQPRWSAPMALVLILLCVEAMLGTLSHRG